VEPIGSTVTQGASKWGVAIIPEKESKKERRRELVIYNYVLAVRLWLGTAIAVARGVKRDAAEQANCD